MQEKKFTLQKCYSNPERTVFKFTARKELHKTEHGRKIAATPSGYSYGRAFQPKKNWHAKNQKLLPILGMLLQ